MLLRLRDVASSFRCLLCSLARYDMLMDFDDGHDDYVAERMILLSCFGYLVLCKFLHHNDRNAYESESES